MATEDARLSYLQQVFEDELDRLADSHDLQLTAAFERGKVQGKKEAERSLEDDVETMSFGYDQAIEEVAEVLERLKVGLVEHSIPPFPTTSRDVHGQQALLSYLTKIIRSK